MSSIHYQLGKVTNQGLGYLKAILAVLISARSLLAQWRHNVRTRQQLAEMSDYMLRDIGISQAQRRREIEKPFWEN